MLFSCLHDQSAELLELLDVHNLLMSKVQLVNVQKQPEKMLRWMNMYNIKHRNLLRMGINLPRMGFGRGRVTFTVEFSLLGLIMHKTNHFLHQVV